MLQVIEAVIAVAVIAELPVRKAVAVSEEGHRCSVPVRAAYSPISL